MVKYPEAISMLYSLKEIHRTWSGVAAELSKRVDHNINVASVWRIANNTGNSKSVYDALGIETQRRYRLTAEFKSEEDLQAFKLLLDKHELKNLTELTGSLLNGESKITSG